MSEAHDPHLTVAMRRLTCLLRQQTACLTTFATALQTMTQSAQAFTAAYTAAQGITLPEVHPRQQEPTL